MKLNAEQMMVLTRKLSSNAFERSVSSKLRLRLEQSAFERMMEEIDPFQEAVARARKVFTFMNEG